MWIDFYTNDYKEKKDVKLSDIKKFTEVVSTGRGSSIYGGLRLGMISFKTDVVRAELVNGKSFTFSHVGGHGLSFESFSTFGDFLAWLEKHGVFFTKSSSGRSATIDLAKTVPFSESVKLIPEGAGWTVNNKDIDKPASGTWKGIRDIREGEVVLYEGANYYISERQNGSNGVRHFVEKLTGFRFPSDIESSRPVSGDALEYFAMFKTVNNLRNSKRSADVSIPYRRLLGSIIEG